MIDLNRERLLTISQAVRKLPPMGGGAKCSPATVWRWIKQGLLLPDGNRIRLEAVRISAWVTSEEAITRFVEALNLARQQAAEATPTIERIRSPKQRESAIRQARRELAKAG